jgi:tetratricopeptide (TPR) repeat protein
VKTLENLEKSFREATTAEPRDEERIAVVCREFLAHPDAASWFHLPLVLEEFINACASLGRYDDAIAAVKQAIAEGLESQPDPRHLISGLLLQAGRPEEAHALYAAIRADTPDDVWLYNAAALDYLKFRDQARGLAWLTDGLALALRTKDRDGLAEQLAERRSETRAALGLPPDGLQREAERLLARSRSGKASRQR